MACDFLTGGIAIGCGDTNSGGLTKVYLIDYDAVTGTTQDSNEQITGFTMSGSATFVEYEFNRNSCEFLENELIDNTAGSAYYEQIVNLIIPKRDYTKRNQIKLLAQRKLIIIVKDANGLYSVGGLNDGFLLNELSSTSGVERAAGSNYSISFRAEENDMAKFATEAAVLAVI